MKMQRETITGSDKVQVTITMNADELEDLIGSLNAGLYGDRYSCADATVREFLTVVGHTEDCDEN